MGAVPLRDYTPGFVDCVTHSLTGAQILYYALHEWRDDQTQPVVLWCRKGDAEWKANALRVALSKERKERSIPRTFELRFSKPWPHTHNGLKGEAIKVERVNGTTMTRIRAAFQQLSIDKDKVYG